MVQLGFPESLQRAVLGYFVSSGVAPGVVDPSVYPVSCPVSLHPRMLLPVAVPPQPHPGRPEGPLDVSVPPLVQLPLPLDIVPPFTTPGRVLTRVRFLVYVGAPVLETFVAGRLPKGFGRAVVRPGRCRGTEVT